MMGKFTSFGLSTVLAAAVAWPAAAETFRYSTSGDVLGLDPHINNEGPTNAMKGNVYEALIHRHPDLSLHPSLATSWEIADDTTWIFHLREGVTFHNGNPFTADDVLFSFDRVRQEQSEMVYTVQSITEMTKIDDFTIQIVTGNGPNPTLLQELPLFFIMDQEWTEENGATEVVRGAGVQTFANNNANGTGPYIIGERVPDVQTVLVRNDDWWGWDEFPDANVTEAILQPISNDATRVAALISGEIDMMYPVPLQDVDRLNASDGVEVLQGPELRTIFLGFDQHREELLDMPGTGQNPFLDQRVRQAFFQAIDIEAIAQVVMRGAATPTGLMVAPGIQGFQEDMNDRLPYDPDAARALLAEAGYPDGFPLTFDCPNDRYVNDEAICLAVVPMLERIGIDVTLNAQTKSLHFNKIGASEGYNTSFFMLGWTPGSYDAWNPLNELMTVGPDGDGGTWNCGRYSNPRVEELTQMIAIETDPEARNEMIREAFQIHKDDVGHITLHQQALAWGVRDNVADIAQRPFNDVDLRFVTMVQ